MSEWREDAKVRWWREQSIPLEYGLLDKIQRLRPLMSGLDKDGGLGTKILDVGCGKQPVSAALINPNVTGRTILGIDVVRLGRDPHGIQFLEYDIREVNAIESRATKKALVTAAKKFGMELPLPKTPVLDTIIFSEILNYVDYQAIISGYARFLKPGGRIIILNNPQRRPPDFAMQNMSLQPSSEKKALDSTVLYDERGAKSNVALEQFMKENFELETVKYPWGLEEAVDKTPGEDLTFMFIVAKKK